MQDAQILRWGSLEAPRMQDRRLHVSLDEGGAAMAEVLILFATREGQTEKIARRMTAVLEARGHRVDLRDVDRTSRELDLRRYQAIFIGSPVRVGSYLPSIVRFVRNRRDALDRTPAAFFSVSLAVASRRGERKTDGRTETLRVVEKLTRATGWSPRRIELMAGALPYSKYNFLVRFVMQRISKAAGGDTDTSRDYEYTDWNAVDRFASEFVDQAIGTRPAQPPGQATARAAP
jgi:menaquinone-dependent protoporphyrinogen oxidase